MNPTAIVELDSMPLTRAGKIDRKSLSTRSFHAESAGGRPPATPTEQLIAQLFADVLHLDDVSADSNFFTLGGDSLVSMQLVALATSAGLTITPRGVFEAKTVAALAAVADRESASEPTGPRAQRPGLPATDSELPRPDRPLVDLTPPDVDRLAQRYPALAEVWPLSPMQPGIHFHSTFDDVDNYTVASMIALSGEVDGERLRRAAQALVDRHDILRVGFIETSTGPVQIVVDHTEVCFREVDVATDGKSGADADIAAFVGADVAAGFDLSVPSLIRFTLVRLDTSTFRLLITNHHMILDGWSMPLLMGELLEYYGAPSRIGVVGPASSYRDYLVWFDGQDLRRSCAVWAEAFADVEASTRVTRQPLPDEGRTAETGAVATGEIQTELSADRCTRLRAVAADAAVTLGTALSAAWALNLRVLTGETDVTFGLAVSGRPPEVPGVDRTLGMFLNTVPIRVPLDPAVSLRQLLIRIQEQYARMVDHHYVGLPDIHRSVGMSELFDTALAFQSFPLHEAALQHLVDSAGLRVDGITGIDATPYPLSLVVAPQRDDGDGLPGLTITLRFRGAAFDAQRAREILDRFVEHLVRIADEPDTGLGVMSPVESGAVCLSRTERPDPATLRDIFAATAHRDSAAIAVTCGDTSLSYRWLDERSTRLRPNAPPTCRPARRCCGIDTAAVHRRRRRDLGGRQGRCRIPADRPEPARRPGRIPGVGLGRLPGDDGCRVRDAATRHRLVAGSRRRRDAARDGGRVGRPDRRFGTWWTDPDR